VERELGFRFQPTMIYVRKQKWRKGQKVYVEEPQPKASWRLFKNLMATKLAAVRLGYVAVEQELMANIIHKLPDGTETTLGETVSGIIAEGNLDQLALEDRRPRKVIEVEAKEVGE